MASKPLGKVSADPVKTWNALIEAFLDARDKWEKHREAIMEYGNIETLPIEAQRVFRYGSVHRATDFERALLQLLNRWRVAGGLDAMLITIKGKGKTDEKK